MDPDALADRLVIEDLPVRYARALDAGDRDRLDEVVSRPDGWRSRRLVEELVWKRGP